MNGSILVANDQPIVLEFITDLLEKEGYRSFIAENIGASLAILKNETPKAVIVDPLMSNGVGGTLCHIIRRNPQLKDLFLILLTSEKEKAFPVHLADQCIATGPFENMSKSILDTLHYVNEWQSGSHLNETEAQVKGFRSASKRSRSIEERFHAILKNLPAGIMEITADNRIIYANPSAQSLAGIPEEDLLASDIRDLFYGKDRKKVENLLAEVTRPSKAMAGQLPVRLRDHEIILTPTPLENEKNLILILDDVSERKRIEAQLYQAQKMEAVGTLAAGIAHDFNNLLMSIQGNTSLLLFGAEPSQPYCEKLKIIEKQVENGSKLTAQLLGYVRQEKEDRTTIDLNDLLKETSDLFARARKEFVIQKELSEDLHKLEAGRGQIEQVLMNLYINAIDAMPEGGILSLMTKNRTHEEIRGKLCHPRPGDYVLLKVSDTGTGMSVETMKHIFDPFFTTKDTGQGTGLGLTSVYAIVEGHGGYIDVESEVGHGTAFSIYLPASKGFVTEQMHHFKKGEVIFGTEGVLLVDDEDEIRNVGREMLETLGYRVLTAGDGEEAVRLFKDHQNDIDIVLLDMVMPHIGGGEIYDRLKRIKRDIIVLLVSGYSIDGKAREILKRGCDGFIQKPFMIDELSQSVRTILQKKGTGEKAEIVCTPHDQTIHVD